MILIFEFTTRLNWCISVKLFVFVKFKGVIDFVRGEGFHYCMSLVAYLSYSSCLVLEILLRRIVILDWLPKFLLIWRILIFLWRVLIAAALWTILVVKKFVESVVREDIAKVLLFISLVNHFSSSKLPFIYIFSSIRLNHSYFCIVSNILDILQLSPILQWVIWLFNRIKSIFS